MRAESVEPPAMSARSSEPQVMSTGSVKSTTMDKRSTETVSPKMGTINDKYYAAQKAEIAGNWKLAVLLYEDVFDNQYSSRLKKEDALFSIGKLHAEHDLDMSGAKEVFLKYLALYPEGSFSGECWLRLAELEFAANPENAIQYYTKFFEMFPRHPRLSELQHRVGVIYLQTKRYREAVSMFRQALKNSATAPDSERRQIYANLYRALEESGDTEAAAIVKKEMLVRSR
jgi:tetratricopeptide (TPR) repeat protein